MTARGYWTRPDEDDFGARERAEMIARRSGMSLGSWIDRVIEDTARDAGYGHAHDRRRPRRADGPRGRNAYAAPRVTDELDDIFDTLEHLARRVGSAESQARSALDAAEDRLAEAGRDGRRRRRVDLETIERDVDAAQADLFSAEADARRTLREVAERARAFGPRDAGTTGAAELSQVTKAVSALESRIDEMMRRFDASPVVTTPVPATDNDLLAQIRSRLENLSERVSTPAPADPRIETSLRGLEDRLAAIASRVDRDPPAPEPQRSDPRVEEALRAMEDRLAQLDHRLNAPAMPAPAPAVDMAAIERLARIEQQLSGLSAQVSRPVIVEQPAPTRAATFQDQLDWERERATHDADLADAIRQIAERQRALEEQLDLQVYGRAIDERFQAFSHEMGRRIDAASNERAIDALHGQLHSLSEKIEQSRRTTVDNEQLIGLQRQVLALRQTLENAVSKTSLAAVVAEVKGLHDKLEVVRRDVPGAPDLTRIEQEMAAIRRAAEAAAPREAFAALEARIGDLAAGLDQRSAQVDPETFRKVAEQVGEVRKVVSEVMSAEAFKDLVSEVRKLDRAIEGVKANTDVAAIEALRRDIGELRGAITAQGEAPRAIAKLSADVQAIGRRFDEARATPAPPTAFPRQAMDELKAEMQAIGRRLDETRAATAPTPALAPQVVDDLKARMDRLMTTVAGNAHAPAIQSLEARIAALAERFDRQQPAPDLSERLVADIKAQIGDAARAFHAGPDAGAVAKLEQRLSDLADKIEAARGVDLDARQLAALEQQIVKLASEVGHVREGTLDAARMAASEAVRHALAERPVPAPQAPNEQLVQALQQNLAELRASKDQSDKRAQDTLLAVHDTLKAVVDRLGALEADRASSRQAAAPVSAAQLPSAALPKAAMMPEAPRAPAPAAAPIAPPKPEKSPIEAAREAAARAAAMRPEPTPMPAAIAADAPLEPGSGRPRQLSVQDAVKAAREQIKAAEERQQPKSEEDVRQSFIAAARRAAAAAASDVKSKVTAKVDGPPKVEKADKPQKPAKPEKPAKAAALLPPAAADGDAGAKGLVGKIAAPLLAHRKQVIMAMAAIVIALGAVHAVRGFIGGADEAPATTAQQEPTRAEPPAGDLAEAARPAAPRETAAAPGAPLALTPPAAEATQQRPPATNAALPAMPDALAVPRLRAAVQQGDARAIFEVGNRLADGRGIARDLPAAATWYRAAAERGSIPAVYRLANMLERGQGVGRDVREAMRLYQQAADAGNRKAMHNLAALLASGADGRADYERAFPMFQRAAELGLADSQYNLAVLFVNGLGTRQNLTDAYVWFAVAAQNGDTEAARRRDEIGGRLDPAGLVNARIQAQSFRARGMDAAANEETIPPNVFDEAPARATQIPQARPNLGIDVGAAQRRG